MSPPLDQPAVALEAEEQARANFYALLARLFYTPPDDQLLHNIATSGDGDEQPSDTTESLDTTGPLEPAGSLDAAWRDLVKL